MEIEPKELVESLSLNPETPLQDDRTLTWIKRCQDKFGTQKYDYSETKYSSIHGKIRVRCIAHNYKFDQIAGKHLRGSFSCPDCQKINRPLRSNAVTKEVFIARSKLLHNNKYSYSKINYVDIKTHVIITCPIHGDYNQTPANHLVGRGCNDCGRESSAKKQTKTTDVFINDANKIHGGKYDYSQTHYITDNNLVTIVCKTHGSFQQLANSHLQGYGCNMCGRESTREKQSLSSEEFIKKAEGKHGYIYDYSKVKYITQRDKVTIICKKHGEFEQKASNHLQGKGCARCRGFNKTTEEIILEFIKVHGNRYEYSEVDYTNPSGFIKILCRGHGAFYTKASRHLKGTGCPDCRYLCRISCTNEEFIEKAWEIHGDTYVYSEINYLNNCTPIKIICNIHGSFHIAPKYHLQGGGCPLCNRIGVSRLQLEWLDSIKSKHSSLQYYSAGGEYRVPNTKYKVDGFLKEGNYGTVYEFHGDFWHGNPKFYDPNEIHPVTKKTYGQLFKNTLYKELTLINLGYKYVCMWESEWNQSKKNSKIN